MAAPPAAPGDLDRSRDLGVDVCGRIAAFWGFTRTMGRTFGLLYLSPAPLPQTAIQARLGVSAGSASMTLTALGRWGVVHKVWVRGERREHYQAETDFWKMIAGVINERERREIAACIETVEKAEAGARAAAIAAAPARGRGKAAAPAPGPDRADAEFVAERLQRLHEICRLGQTMLDMLLGQMKLDVGRFRDVLRVAAPEPAEPPDAAVEKRTNRAAASPRGGRRPRS